MLNVIFQVLIDALLGPSVGKRFVTLRYIYSFFIGFLLFPTTLFFYFLYKAGWSKTLWAFSKMLVEHKAGDLGFLIFLSLIFGISAVLMTALGRAKAPSTTNQSPDADKK